MPRFRRLRRPSRKPSPKIDEPAAAPEIEETLAATPAVTAEEPPEAGKTLEASDTLEAPAAPAAEESPESGADDVEDAEDVEATDEVEDTGDARPAPDAGVGRGPSRMGRGWLSGIAAALVLLAGGVGAGGYLALRYHHESQVIARNDAAALKAAVDCVSATQAPDTQAMAASAQKIIDCGTGDYHSQALVNTSMLIQAYQAANIHVEVSSVRAAVERNNDDGSIEVLVAMRVKVASDQQQNETGYRLKATMAFAEGQYRISRLVPVTK